MEIRKLCNWFPSQLKGLFFWPPKYILTKTEDYSKVLVPWSPCWALAESSRPNNSLHILYLFRKQNIKASRKSSQKLWRTAQKLHQHLTLNNPKIYVTKIVVFYALLRMFNLSKIILIKFLLLQAHLYTKIPQKSQFLGAVCFEIWTWENHKSMV